MSKQIKEMSAAEIENLQTLGLDDSFDFHCKACGKCCKNREDLLLTPYDTYRIADFLGRTPQDILTRYCEIYEGPRSHFPIVRVIPVSPNNSCPFLRDKKCIVHAKKPVLCRVYPLARMYFGPSNGSRYYFNGSSCKHEPRRITVREWIADVADDESEKAGLLWQKIIAAIHPLIQPNVLKHSMLNRQNILELIAFNLWLNYDMKTSFIPQLEENFKKVQAFLALIESNKVTA